MRSSARDTRPELLNVFNDEGRDALDEGYLAPPPAVWKKIASRLDPGARARRRVAVAVVSVAAAVVALLGVRVAGQERQIQRTQSEVQDRAVLTAALAAQSDPAARRANLVTGDGRVLAHAVLTPNGMGYLWSDGLPSIRPGHTYQLWAVIGNEPISAGLLGADPRVVTFRASGHVLGLAITEERAGGVPSSQNHPLVSALVQEA